MTLITLYDVGAYVAMLAHGALPALLAVADGHLLAISRAEWLMADEPSGIGDVVMLGPGSIEHRELVYCYMRKSTTFHPPWCGPPL